MGRAFLLDNSRLFNRYGIIVTQKTDEQFWPLHWHDCWELEIVTGGKGRQLLNGTPYELERGAVYMLSPTDFHEVSCSALSLYSICFRDERLPGTFINHFSGGKSGRFTLCRESELQILTWLCDRLLEESETAATSFSEQAVEHLLGLLFVQLLRLFDVETEGRKEETFPLISRAVSYINLHFREDPSLSDVAERLCITPNYLSERFHAETGRRYKEYLTETKLQYAKKLLETGGLSVTEVCFASGFSSLSNFLRVFKNRYQVSPKEVRKNPS